jgi:GAF domain-containing protein
MPDDHNPIRAPRRLAALRRAGLTGMAGEEPFDQLARLAARLTHSPTALVSLVDEDRQLFKGACGVAEPWGSEGGTPLSHSFCKHVVASGEPLVVEDAREHPLLRDNPAIREMGVIAYLGVPLSDGEGNVLGSLCVVDSKPRQWTDDEVEVVRSIAPTVMSTVEMRAAAVEARESAGDAAKRRMRDAADALWRSVTDYLRRIQDYDDLIRDYVAAPESAVAETRSRERVLAAEQVLRRVVASFDEVSSRARDGDELVLRHAYRLWEASRTYFQAEEEREQAGLRFRQRLVPLAEFERACARVGRVEEELREAALAYETA